MAKNQIPVVGGIRKVVKTPPAQSPGTTIAEYGSGTITLAQLRQALGVIVQKPNTQGGGGGGAAATIVPGPGLSGGGPVLGNVPINLTAPIPVFIFDDGGGGDGDAAPIPGPAGPSGSGATGAPGPAGPAIFMTFDDPEAPHDAIPGSVGPAGINGTTGAVGPAGPAIFMTFDDPEAPHDAIPGAVGPASTVPGPAGAPGPAIFMLADDGADGERGPPGPAGTGGSSGGGEVAYFGFGQPSTLHNDGDLFFDVSVKPSNGYIQVNHPMALPDGTAASGIWSSGTTGTVAGISATAQAQFVMVVVGFEQTTAGITVSSVTAPGLTFSKIANVDNAGASNWTYAEVWVAPLSGAISGVTATITLSAAIDDAAAVAFGVDYVPSANQIATGGLPFGGHSAGVVTSGTITQPAGTTIYCIQANGANTLPLPPTGFVNVATAANGGGSRFMELAVSNLQLTTSLSGTISSITTGNTLVMLLIGFSPNTGSVWVLFGK